MSQRPPLRLMKRTHMTARELAEKAGISVSTAMRWTAEPREDYLARAQSRGEKIRELRAEGLSMRTIANELGCSVGTVHRHVHHPLLSEFE